MLFTLGLALSVLMTLIAGPANAETDSVVLWEPAALSIALPTGTLQVVEVAMTLPDPVNDPSLSVPSSISDFFYPTVIRGIGIEIVPLPVNVNEADGANNDFEFDQEGLILPQGTYLVTAVLQVPANTAVGSYEGTVQLASGGNSLAGALDVAVTVLDAAAGTPEGIALLSSDRLIDDGEGRLLVADEVVVGLALDNPHPAGTIAGIVAAVGATVIGSISDAGVYQLRFLSATDVEAQRAALEAFPDVEFASLSRLSPFEEALSLIPDDEQWRDPWDENNPEGINWPMEIIRAPSAWDTTTGNRDIGIAIIDVDIDPSHEDLVDNFDFSFGSRPSVIARNQRGHGTHVAGTACARGNNTIGVTGVSWLCSLRSYEAAVPVIDTAGRTIEYQLYLPLVMAEMIDAADRGARAVNLSLGSGYGECFANPNDEIEAAALEQDTALLRRAISYVDVSNLDVLWVAAAGNNNCNAAWTTPANLSFEFPLNFITVAAIRREGDLASYSNYGDRITVAAPGGEPGGIFGIGASSVLSTIPEVCNLFLCTRYGNKVGTSTAAPHVTGLAALVMAANPDFSATEVKACIVTAAESEGREVPGHGFRAINADAAVRCEGHPTLPSKVDIFFSLDLTGSMRGELTQLKEEIGDIINGVAAAAPATDFRFGVVSYEDYSGFFDSTSCGSSYSRTYGGGAIDEPFRINSTLTADPLATIAAVNSLVIGNGFDSPESYARALWEIGQTDTRVALGARPDALQLIINFGDNVPHDTDLNEGIEFPPVPSPYDTGIDPGRNATIDCDGDDIDLQDDALIALIDADTKLLHIDSSEAPDLAQYWSFWAARTGGAFAAINRDGTVPGGLDLTELITDLLGLID